MPLKIHETAERRQVTILHCDIVNSTEIVDSLDPEDVLSIMEAYLDGWIEIVEEFRGSFVGYTGDGFQAYFGYPFSREDAAADALSAGLKVSSLFAGRDNKVQQELFCRIGIATGQVVIAQPSSRKIARKLVAFGSVPCLATRLEQAAAPGHILIDDATRKLTQNQFVFREIGPVPAKGFRHDVDAWEVVRKRRPGPRFDTSRLSPFVDRHAELEFLTSRWPLVAKGHGQVVIVKGEAGMGKSRLVFEFEQSLASQLAGTFRFQCSSLNTSTPLHPWFHWVQRFADIRKQDSAETAHAKLYDCLHDKLGFSDEIVSYSETVIGIDTTGTGTYSRAESKKILERLQEALVDNLIGTAADAPVLVLLEDVQWMDASTHGLLQRLVERVSTNKVYLILTSRPEDAPSFDLPHVASLSLPRLNDETVSILVSAFFAKDERSTDNQSLKSTIEKCQGNPLFVEEFAKHFLEQDSPVSLAGGQRSEADRVPLLLQSSLLERIDTAGKGKEIAQLASVLGPEFDRDILISLSNKSAKNVQQILDQLVELNIFSRASFNDREIYAFRHALLRDAVYSSLLLAARSAIHLKVASLLAGASRTYSAEIIARHFEDGGDLDNAFVYWLEAGQHALQSGATQEAVNLLASAHAIAQDFDETPDRLRGLADMYLAYAHALNASLGVAAEPIRYYRKAEEYATQLDDNALVFESLDWQFGVQFNAGDLNACMEPALKLKELGLATNDRTAIVSGYQAMGMALFMQGEFANARAEFEQGLKAADDYVSGEHCFPSMTLSYLAWTYFILGQVTEAAACVERAIESARRESPHAVSTALSNCSYVYQCIGAVDKVYACADELLEFAKRHGELMILNRCIVTRNWADCMSGRDHKAIEAISQHIDLLLNSGEQIEVTYNLGLLADLQVRQARYIDAVATIDRALKIAEKNQEYFYVSELYRLKAEAFEQSPDVRPNDDDTDYLIKAEETATSQQAQSWLARLHSTARDKVH